MASLVADNNINKQQMFYPLPKRYNKIQTSMCGQLVADNNINKQQKFYSQYST
jgi:hypothetical protein